MLLNKRNLGYPRSQVLRSPRTNWVLVIMVFSETLVTSFLEMASPKTKTAVAIFLIFIARCISEETCKKDGTCSCKFKNGSVVNLRPEDGGKNKPKLVLHGVIVF